MLTDDLLIARQAAKLREMAMTVGRLRTTLLALRDRCDTNDEAGEIGHWEHEQMMEIIDAALFASDNDAFAAYVRDCEERANRIPALELEIARLTAKNEILSTDFSTLVREMRSIYQEMSVAIDPQFLPVEWLRRNWTKIRGQ